MQASPGGTAAPDSAPAPPRMVCFPLAGDLTVGGGHVSVLLLIQHLDRQRYRPILAVHGDGPVRRWLAEQGLRGDMELLNGRIQGRRSVWLRDAALVGRRSWGWAQFLRRHKVAIVHVNDTIMLGTWALATRLGGAKLLWHKRGAWTGKWLHRVWLRLADHVIAISRFAAPPHPSAKCSVIYNPFAPKPDLDRAASRAAVLQERRLPSDAILLGFFGFIDRPQKRPVVFLETIARVAERLPHLAIAGLLFGECSAETERTLRARAESLGIAHRVHFMGFRYPPDPWYAACDLLLVPGVGEGFGRTLVEAMLLGTIAVAADSGGHRETIKHGKTGFLVRPDDPQAFADRVCGLLERPDEIARLASRAREDAARRFGIGQHVRAVIEVYDALLSRGEGAAASPTASCDQRCTSRRTPLPNC
jgi:glycosyltransferase involved in cell wall biosynthesis